MSLQCLAILGNKNEPLYCTAPENSSKAKVQNAEDKDIDSFGFIDSMGINGQSIHQEFMIHTALDRLDELLGSPKNSGLPWHSRGFNWIGSICVMEDSEIYGYITSSNAKILALIKRKDVLPLQKRNEGDIRMLFVSSVVFYGRLIVYARNKFLPSQSYFFRYRKLFTIVM
jgi:hypothetical protein